MAWSSKTLLFLLDVCIISTLYVVKSEDTCGDYDGVQSSECTDGFPTQFYIDLLKGNTDLDMPDSRQVLIPDINFMCNGSITRWIIGARWEGLSPAHTELQIWRKNSETTYTKVDGTTLVVGARNLSEVYEYVLETPLAFKEGDILGYFQPIRNRSEINLHLEDSRRLTTYYRRLGVNDLDPPASGALFSLNTASVGTRYPVIAVTTDPPDCGCGFMSAERVYALLDITDRKKARFFREEQLAIFPDITFTCSGEVVKWIMGGRFRDSEDRFPELQTWRPSGGSVYQKVNSTVISGLYFEESDDEVYMYTVDPPLPFQPGDILGLFHPDAGDSVLRLYYDRDSTSVFYSQYLSMSETGNTLFNVSDDKVITRNGIPLVTAGIAPRRSTLAPLRSSPAPYGSSPVSDIIPTETTVGGSLHTPLPSSSAALYGSSPVSDIIPTETTVCGGLHTPLPNSSAEDISPSVSSGIIIASVGASVVVVLLIVTAVIVISVLVCLRKRSKGQHINNTDSVTYQHNSITKSYNSPYIGTSPTSGHDISTSTNDAYGILHKETATDTSTTCEGAVYEEVTTSETVERIHVSTNQAYGTTLHPINNDEHDYV